MEIRPGQLLPDLTFPAAASDAAPLSLRGGRGPRALVVLHGADCAACSDYARRVADAAAAAAEWGGRMIVVVPGEGVAPPAADALPARGAAPRGAPALPGPRDREGIAVVRDPDGALLSGAPFVAVADEWGEICFASEGEGPDAEGEGPGAEGEGRDAAGRSAHGLPDPAELADWIRFAAIQCPECEGPEGEWRTL